MPRWEIVGGFKNLLRYRDEVLELARFELVLDEAADKGLTTSLEESAKTYGVALKRLDDDGPA